MILWRSECGWTVLDGAVCHVTRSGVAATQNGPRPCRPQRLESSTSTGLSRRLGRASPAAARMATVRKTVAPGDDFDRY